VRVFRSRLCVRDVRPLVCHVLICFHSNGLHARPHLQASTSGGIFHLRLSRYRRVLLRITMHYLEIYPVRNSSLHSRRPHIRHVLMYFQSDALHWKATPPGFYLRGHISPGTESVSEDAPNFLSGIEFYLQSRLRWRNFSSSILDTISALPA